MADFDVDSARQTIAQHLASSGPGWLPARNVGEVLRAPVCRPATLEMHNTLAALVGYRQGRWELRASARNITDRRDAVAESELGDAQYYRLFPRRFEHSSRRRRCSHFGKRLGATFGFVSKNS